VIALAIACGGPMPEAPSIEAPPTGIPLAITIDDLPYVGPADSAADRTLAIERIVRAAREAGAPITGFATCRRIAEDGSDLRLWSEAGVPIENHSSEHRAIDDLGLDAWRADLVRCQERITEITGRAPAYYRYPFLRTGRDPALRDASLAALGELGLSPAPVSIDTSDWALAAPYVAATADERAHLTRVYVEHVRAAARRYRARAAALGRPRAAHVLLLHANAPLADGLGAILAMLREEGFSFVPLAEALADPIYREPDLYAGGIGMSWLYRIEPDGERWWAWDDAQAHVIGVRYGQEQERDRYRIERDVSIRRLDDTTWIVIEEEPWPANILVARLPSAILIVSTPYADDSTNALLAWIRLRIDERIPIVAINPHFHPDGVGGNRALREAGVRTLGTEHTARLTVERAGAIRAQMIESLPDRPDQRARFERYDPLPPEEMIGPGSLDQFGEPIHIVSPGAAHSPDNIAVYLPNRGLLFGGCMVAARDHIGNVVDADLESWPRAIERLRELHARVIVPGHGERTDPELLDHTLELLTR
jgi:metallo-beta-lactamase class B